MSNTAIAEREEAQVPATATAAPSRSPMIDMLSEAIRSGQPIEVIRELKAMAKEFEADEKRAAFDAAIADAKSEISPIIRTRDAHNSKYADFAAIAMAVDPVLSRHGLSYRHRSEVADNKITVVCRLAHKAGHFEETALPAPPDTSGSKNAIQAIGSTLTYLQRYTLLLALGLSTAHDDDGQLSGAGEVISDEQRAALLTKLDAKKADVGKFCAYFKVPTIAALPVKRFDEAMKMVEAKK